MTCSTEVVRIYSQYVGVLVCVRSLISLFVRGGESSFGASESHGSISQAIRLLEEINKLCLFDIPSRTIEPRNNALIRCTSEDSHRS